jgi:hypothetical protein
VPIHDWTRVQSGLFHEFHQCWSVRIKDALNASFRGKDYYALVEQKVDGPEPDVIAVEMKARGRPAPAAPVATLEPPKLALTARVRSDAARYARKANRISVRHVLGDVVAVIEIVSPGNKDSRHAIKSFVEKATAFLRHGVHLLVVDLFPPTERDPRGVHKVIWDEFADEPFELPPGKPLTLVSYQAGDELTAHIEPTAVGAALPDMPLFLAPGLHVMVPLEATYAATYAVCPEPIRELVEAPPNG